MDAGILSDSLLYDNKPEPEKGGFNRLGYCEKNILYFYSN